MQCKFSFQIIKAKLKFYFDVLFKLNLTTEILKQLFVYKGKYVN